MEYPRDFHRGRRRARRADRHEWPQHFRRPAGWKAPGWRRRERRWEQALGAAIVIGVAIGFWASEPPRSASPPLAAHGDYGVLPQGDPPMRASAPISAQFGLCHTGGGTNCVVDGDTFWVGGEKVRVADIDAPETHPPRCAEEARLGEAATLRLQALLNAGPVTLAAADRDVDRYGRKLRVVERGGQSLGMTLVSEGLARDWEGARRPWC